MLDDTELPGLGLRVLLVDDDEIVLEVFADMLAALGADVMTATSVGEARPLLQSFAPALVITDIYMPDESGQVMRDEVLRWNPAVPVVALTGAGETGISPDAGFTHVLQKPLVLDTLAGILKAIPREEGSP